MIWPFHDSKPISLVKLPLALKSGYLVVVHEFVELIKDHCSIATSLAISKHADVLVTAFEINYAIIAETAFDENSILTNLVSASLSIGTIRMLKRLEYVTFAVHELSSLNLVILKQSCER